MFRKAAVAPTAEGCWQKEGGRHGALGELRGPGEKSAFDSHGIFRAQNHGRGVHLRHEKHPFYILFRLKEIVVA